MYSTIARFVAIVVMVLTIPLTAHARQPVPIVDFPDNAVYTNSGKTLTVEQVRDAITSAAQGRSWQISRSPSGNSLQATLNVRGKHTVVVEIVYSEKTYSIAYQNSANMKFSSDPDTKVRVIHPFYNRWVSELREAIRTELQKL